MYMNQQYQKRLSRCYFRCLKRIYSRADSINDFLYVIETGNAHNFADDNTLTVFANSIQNLIHLMEFEISLTIKWLKTIR